ncbi:ADAMTS-like protein 2 [Tachyglossus aculeatus]|uniref:ADAMTS-like protein 2 n=1 Tax=Tachyglossus aculeatus TaxID=9261 RepID=UPI0018F6B3D9|nr:ADAMTS-like protein 2 [Tachyglossus aculeatus]
MAVPLKSLQLLLLLLLLPLTPAPSALRTELHLLPQAAPCPASEGYPSSKTPSQPIQIRMLVRSSRHFISFVSVSKKMPICRESSTSALREFLSGNSSEASEAAGAWDVEITKWWGEWSSWSTCSRTCGGGVMSRERHCLFQRLLTSQGINTPMCTGQSKRYQLCQQEPCPANSDSFKQQQCSGFNAKAFGKYYYHWMPLYPDDYTSISNKPCDLHCTTQSGERQLIVQAQDGTSCRERLYQGVCISGKCEPVGCDGSLYSSQTMDRCRVCGGDGSTCYWVSGSFRKGISQLGSSFTSLNVSNNAKEVIWSWLLSSWCPFPPSDPIGQGASCTALFPLTPQSLAHLEMGVDYKIFDNDFDVRPLGHDDISLADMYHWKVSAYGPCSTSCASGISTSYALCVRYDGVEVEEAYCDALTRPEPTHELCTGRDCQPGWETSRWSECSRTCGEGHRARNLRCWRMLAPGFDSSVYDEVCQAAGLVRPMERKVCRSQACGPQWELSEWSECSHCGSMGTVRREVRCSVEPPLCSDATRPASEKECQGPPCNWHWMASEWGPCSGACGEGRMTRFVLCRNVDGKVISDAQCDLATKPLAIYPCGDRNCPAHWVEQEWEPCNASCGRGMKARSVLCARLENGVYREYPEAQCEAFPKPEVQAACFKRPCSVWLTTAWSLCSKTCGMGVRMREVKCYQGEELGQGCDPTAKPEAKQVCQVEPCPTEAPDNDCEDRATANCALVVKVLAAFSYYNYYNTRF